MIIPEQLTDDRGRRVPALSLSQSKQDPQAERIYRQVLLSCDPNKQGIRSSLPTALLMLVSIIVWMTVVPWVIKAFNLPIWSVFVCFLFYGAPFSLLRKFQIRQQFVERIAPSMLAEGFCPSCAYRLESCAADDTSMVTCPECASSWWSSRMPRVSSDGVLSEPHVIYPEEVPNPSVREWLRRVFMSAPIVLDDRQRVITLVDVRTLRHSSLVSEDKMNRVNHALRSSVISKQVSFGLIYSAATCAMVLLATLSTSNIVRVIFAVNVCFMGFTAIRFFQYRSSQTTKYVRGAMLSQGLCPSCAADLTDTPAEHDNTHRCPQCATHWRLN